MVAGALTWFGVMLVLMTLVATVFAPSLATIGASIGFAGARVIKDTTQAELPPGFQLQVFAAEPDVRQPIGIATDSRGRLWVAENYTYSESAVNFHPTLRDRVIILEDRDHDGRADHRYR